jgi:proteic killer suppression protein
VMGCVEITFRQQRLRKTFSSEREIRKEYGNDMARTIMRRLAVLNAAPTLTQVPIVPPLRRHLLSDARKDQYAVDLVHPRRLIFEVNHNPVPRYADGGIDTDQITAITIIEVVDYH